MNGLDGSRCSKIDFDFSFILHRVQLTSTRRVRFVE